MMHPTVSPNRPLTPTAYLLLKLKKKQQLLCTVLSPLFLVVLFL